MAEDIGAPIESIIKTFETRARRRQWGAFGFLALMLAGIAAAAYVFVQAKEITDRETTTDIPSRISSLQKRIDENQSKIREIETAERTALLNLWHELPTKTECLHTIEATAAGPYPLFRNLIFPEHGEVRKSKTESTKWILGFVKDDSDCISFPLYLGVGETETVTLDVEKLKTLNAQEWTDHLPESLETERRKLFAQMQLNQKAGARLHELLEQQEIAPLIGEPESHKTPVTLSLPFLLQLNITRFGTITLVAIALGILAPLYRFSARLATFYQARADILRLHQMPGYKQTGIVRLSPIFTPTFDFGKSQAMPDHITEVIRAALAQGKDAE